MLSSLQSPRSGLLSWLLLAMVCGLAFFWRLGGNGIWDLDEALYVESAREMRLTGDYITPRVNGEPFFEKPPLIYWEAAGVFYALGESEAAARLPSALASAALAGILFVIGWKLFGRGAAVTAAVFFSLSPLALGAARQLTTDATLNLCISAALLCFFFITTTPPASRLPPPASRLPPPASHLLPHASRLTPHASRLCIVIFSGSSALSGFWPKGCPES